MDCLQLADRINALAARLEDGDMAATEELFGLFAPTTAWDDAGGSVETGNRVFELLRPMLKF